MKKAYHTETQEDFNALMKNFEKQGYIWWGYEKKPTEILDIWEVYKEKTCVRLGKGKYLNFSHYTSYKQRGYEIIEYKVPTKDKENMKLENVFTSECDEYYNIWESQKFCTVLMKEKQSLYHKALKLEVEARNYRERVLKDLEQVVAEEKKVLLENMKQLDKAL